MMRIDDAGTGSKEDNLSAANLAFQEIGIKRTRESPNELTVTLRLSDFSTHLGFLQQLDELRTIDAGVRPPSGSVAGRDRSRR